MGIFAGILAALPAFWITQVSGTALVRSILDEGPLEVPRWLESWLPARGKWLRLLVWTPVVLPMIMSMFAAAFLTGYAILRALLG